LVSQQRTTPTPYCALPGHQSSNWTTSSRWFVNIFHVSHLRLPVFGGFSQLDISGIVGSVHGAYGTLGGFGLAVGDVAVGRRFVEPSGAERALDVVRVDGGGKGRRQRTPGRHRSLRFAGVREDFHELFVLLAPIVPLRLGGNLLG